MNWFTNIYLWMGGTFLFLLLFMLMFIFLVVLMVKTHAIVEFKSWMKGQPIALFFEENRYVEWKPVEPEGGIVTDKHYGGFIINERATYVDKKTKNVLIPFDANFGASVNIHTAKLCDDLQYIVKDEEQMKQLRTAIADNTISENASIDVLKTSIHIGAIKNMMTALIPHNITAKIEKTITQRMQNYSQPNVMQIALLFAAVLGAIIMGYILLKTVA